MRRDNALFYVRLLFCAMTFMLTALNGVGEAAKGLAVVQRQALSGVIDESGKEILPVAFARVVILENQQIAVKKGGLYGVYNASGEIVIPPQYTQLLICEDGTYLLRNGERKWGAVAADGREVLPFEYKQVFDGDRGVFCVRREEGWWQLVRGEGVPVDGNGYSLLGNCCEGRVAASANNRWGFLDYDGHYAVEPQYEGVRAFSEGLAAVKRGGKWGFVDTEGKTVIRPQFSDLLYGFREGLACVRQDGKLAVIDTSGNVIFKKNFNLIFPFHDGLAEVRKTKKKLNVLQAIGYGVNIALGRIGRPPANIMDKTQKRGYIDREGREIVPTSYDAVMPFHDGLAIVKKGKRWGALDRTGATRLELRFEELRSFHEGLAAARLDGKWNIIDVQGNVKRELPPTVQDVGEFGMGLFPVKTNGKWGYMDVEGHIVIAPAYTNVRPFVPQGSADDGQEVYQDDAAEAATGGRE